ncbi:phage minor head protein [uncultured Shewanella sp.]|uniref:phage head morphogenesis protein n=1 Tax=uncultured Shewanella sp. TaxID=173975 RepID=UPI0026294CAA|nr:phage minor head protein [uncultured Shewanella sp.]
MANEFENETDVGIKAQYGSQFFIQAIAFFRAKLNLPTAQWDDLWRAAHNRAFVVAGAMEASLLTDLREAVDSAISQGKSISWFQREFKSIVAKNGWSHTGKSDWRANIIYSTNVRQSYNAGRYEQLQSFDYWEYQHGDSRYPRELHLKWHGTVLPKDDPWWLTHFPSNGWGCKCRVRGRSRQALKRLGLQVNDAPVIEYRDWLNKKTGEVHKVPKGIDPSFDYAPKRGDLKVE